MEKKQGNQIYLFLVSSNLQVAYESTVRPANRRHLQNHAWKLLFTGLAKKSLKQKKCEVIQGLWKKYSSLPN